MPTDTWVCPPGVTSVFVECWGSGSSGGVSGLGTGAGGGGGSYARKLVAVTPGNSYNVTWGPGNTNVQTVFDIFFSANPCVASITGAAAGASGDVNYSGGNGQSGQFDGGSPADTLFASRGGGSSGGRNGNGINASGPFGAVVVGGGNGGDGGSPYVAGHPDGSNPNCIGTDGVAAGPGPGGGGGGNGWNVFCPGIASGAGGEGGIYIWDDTAGGDFDDVILDPGNIVGAFGSVPPAPVLPNPKAVKRAFVM